MRAGDRGAAMTLGADSMRAAAGWRALGMGIYSIAALVVLVRAAVELAAQAVAPHVVLAFAAGGALLVAVAAVVDLSASDHPAASAFGRATAVLGVWMMVNRVVFPEIVPTGVRGFDGLLSLRPLLTAAVVPLVAHMALVFPTRHWLLRRHRRATMVVLYGQLALYLIDDILVWLGIGGAHLPDVLAQFSGLVLLLLVSAVFATRHRDRESSGRLESGPWIMTGLLAALLPAVLLVVLPGRLLGIPPPFGPLPLLSILALPLSFGFAILRDHALGADLVLRRTLAELAGTVLMGGSFLTVAALVAAALAERPGLTPTDLVAAVLVTGIGAVVLLRLGLVGYRRIDRLFDRDRFRDRQILERLAAELPTAPTAAELARQIASSVPTALGLRSASVCIAEGEDGEADDPTVEAVPEPLRLTRNGILARAQRGSAVLRRADPDGGPDLANLPVEEHSLLCRRATAAVVPIAAQGELLGVLLVGPPRSGRVLDAEDEALLRTLASQAAISLVNGQLVARERRTATYHRNVLAGIATGVVTLDERGCVGSFNRAAARILNTNAEVFLGRALTEVAPLAPFLSSLELTRRKGVQDQGEIRVDTRIVAYQTLPLLGATSRTLLGVQLLFDDVTERRRLEKIANVQSKMETLGRFSGFIVHDVGSINSEMDGVLARLRRRGSSDPEVAEALQDLRAQTGRIHELVRTQREFVRGKAPERKPVDLCEVVLGALGSVRRADRIVVRREPWEEVPVILGDHLQLRRAIENLACNAAQAMGESGTLRLGVFRGDKVDVVVEVSDTGPGIPPERREDLFEPLTSSRQGGQGLGLALVLQTITAHGGTIHVESDPAVGTTFQLRLPQTIANGGRT